MKLQHTQLSFHLNQYTGIRGIHLSSLMGSQKMILFKSYFFIWKTIINHNHGRESHINYQEQSLLYYIYFDSILPRVHHQSSRQS